MNTNNLFFKGIFYSLLALLITACATSITGRKQLMLVSESTAINASKQAYIKTLEPLQKDGKIDSDPKLVKRINDITNKLIVQAEKLRPDTKDWDWTVKVIDDPKTVNAWCMAGGKMEFLMHWPTILLNACLLRWQTTWH